MTLPSSPNSISFRQIRDEFGSVPTSPSGYSLGGYRISQEIDGSGLTLPLDDGIPSGSNDEIKFSDFYGKRLNVVVDCYSGDTENRVNVKNSKWTNDKTIVIGGFRLEKEAGSRIRIAVNKKFGSVRGPATNCALRTGSWDPTAQVVVEVAANGEILGAGGDGGTGGQISGGIDGAPGSEGGGALGIEASGTIVNVRTGGIINGGFGGGGGGGGQRETSGLWSNRKASGGGGGGGAGLPPGKGGAGGSESRSGSAGNDGEETEGGTGGGGGNNANEAVGGKGGDGGDAQGAATAGATPSTAEGRTLGGAGGATGGAIRRTSGASFTIGTNDGTITGSTNQTGVT